MKKIVYLLLLGLLWQSCDRDKTEKVQRTHKRKVARVQRKDSLRFLTGEKLFMAHCAPCHSTSEEVIVGPGLVGVTQRLTPKQIKRWIKEPHRLLEEGDPYAIRLFKEYHNTAMPSFPGYTDKELEAIIFYIEEKGKKTRT